MLEVRSRVWARRVLLWVQYGVEDVLAVEQLYQRVVKLKTRVILLFNLTVGRDQRPYDGDDAGADA